MKHNTSHSHRLEVEDVAIKCGLIARDEDKAKYFGLAHRLLKQLYIYLFLDDGSLPDSKEVDNLCFTLNAMRASQDKNGKETITRVIEIFQQHYPELSVNSEC